MVVIWNIAYLFGLLCFFWSPYIVHVLVSWKSSVWEVVLSMGCPPPFFSVANISRNSLLKSCVYIERKYI